MVRSALVLAAASTLCFLKPRRALACLLLALAVTSPAAARTWIVSQSGPADSRTVQGGIDRAAALDTVLVLPGTYHESISFLGKGIVVMSRDGASATTIDASGLNSSVVLFMNQEPPTAVLEGFTITGGRGSMSRGGPDGGGILCYGGSPTIRGNLITHNQARYGGGLFIGVYWLEDPVGSPVIEGNRIIDNHADYNGGGVQVSRARSLIEGNLIEGNTADYDGGGVNVYLTGGTASVISNMIIRNIAGDHGGGLLWFCETTLGCEGGSIRLNIVAENVARGIGTGDTGTGGGLYLGGGPVLVDHNTIVLNRASGESPCSGGGIGFINSGGWDEIVWNIIAFNTDCGMTCRSGGNVGVGRNIIWNNAGGDVDNAPSRCSPSVSTQLWFADPLFCDLSAENVAVASNSPALVGGETYGANLVPGCADVPVLLTTWGAIKSMFRSEPQSETRENQK